MQASTFDAQATAARAIAESLSEAASRLTSNIVEQSSTQGAPASEGAAVSHAADSTDNLSRINEQLERIRGAASEQALMADKFEEQAGSARQRALTAAVKETPQHCQSGSFHCAPVPPGPNLQGFKPASDLPYEREQESEVPLQALEASSGALAPTAAEHRSFINAAEPLDASRDTGGQSQNQLLKASLGAIGEAHASQAASEKQWQESIDVRRTSLLEQQAALQSLQEGRVGAALSQLSATAAAVPPVGSRERLSAASVNSHTSEVAEQSRHDLEAARGQHVLRLAQEEAEVWQEVDSLRGVALSAQQRSQELQSSAASKGQAAQQSAWQAQCAAASVVHVASTPAGNDVAQLAAVCKQHQDDALRLASAAASDIEQAREQALTSEQAAQGAESASGKLTGLKAAHARVNTQHASALLDVADQDSDMLESRHQNVSRQVAQLEDVAHSTDGVVASLHAAAHELDRQGEPEAASQARDVAARSSDVLVDLQDDLLVLQDSRASLQAVCPCTCFVFSFYILVCNAHALLF